MKPTIGRQVHYYPGDQSVDHEPYAATIVGLYAASVTRVVLAVMIPDGVHDMIHLKYVDDVPFAEDYSPGCWSWPPRV